MRTAAKLERAAESPAQTPGGTLGLCSRPMSAPPHFCCRSKCWLLCRWQFSRRAGLRGAPKPTVPRKLVSLSATLIEHIKAGLVGQFIGVIQIKFDPEPSLTNKGPDDVSRLHSLGWERSQRMPVLALSERDRPAFKFRTTSVCFSSSSAVCSLVPSGRPGLRPCRPVLLLVRYIDGLP